MESKEEKKGGKKEKRKVNSKNDFASGLRICQFWSKTKKENRREVMDQSEGRGAGFKGERDGGDG